MALGKMIFTRQQNWVLHDKKFAFMMLKKCGSVTFSKVIDRSLGYKTSPKNRIKAYCSRRTFLMDNKYELDALDYDKVAWIRNPFDRLVSAYVHLICNRSHVIRDFGIPRTTSFEDYIDYICSFKEDKDLNTHFHQQTFDIAIKDRLIPNFIIRLENLQEEWEEVRKQFEWLAPIEWHMHRTGPGHDSIPGTGARGNYRQYYTKNLVEKVNNRFAKDLELLEYEF